MKKHVLVGVAFFLFVAGMLLISGSEAPLTHSALKPQIDQKSRVLRLFFICRTITEHA